MSDGMCVCECVGGGGVMGHVCVMGVTCVCVCECVGMYDEILTYESIKSCVPDQIAGCQVSVATGTLVSRRNCHQARSTYNYNTNTHAGTR